MYTERNNTYMTEGQESSQDRLDWLTVAPVISRAPETRRPGRACAQTDR